MITDSVGCVEEEGPGDYVLMPKEAVKVCAAEGEECDEVSKATSCAMPMVIGSVGGDEVLLRE